MARRVGLAVVAVLVALALAQLLLPRIAERRLRSSLARYGKVESAHVSAFPAIELLWNHADSVSIVLSRYRSGRVKLGDFLGATGSADRLDARVATLVGGRLTLHDVRFRKRGARLTGSAVLRERDLRAALPPGLGIEPIASGGGALVFRASVHAFGFDAGAPIVLAARDGALLLAPDVPFGGLVALRVFDAARVRVESVGAVRAGSGFRLEASARLRG